MFRRHSYDPNATTPAVGSRWVWEIDQPHAVCLIEVIETFWNGEEWWVRTRNMISNGAFGGDWLSSLGDDPRVALNDLGRFAEAVTPVGSARGSWVRKPALARSLDGEQTTEGA